MGLLDDRKKTQYLQMAEEKLQGLLNLPQQAQRFLTSPTAFLGLLGQNPLPRESGFAAGATGLPPTEMSVLDPNQAPYMQGYGQGEPVGYAGLALPLAAPAAVATGKALAPKAGLLAENYMQRMGGLIPLEAYHGTPHNIQGKFDINKVGTGEGAQVYGYGMYFGEARGTGETYRKSLSGRTDLNEMPSDPAFIHAVNSFREAGYPLQAIPAEIKKAYKSATDKDIKLAIQATEKGNLYKVDIPDKDIPNMLDWDKKVPEDLRKRISAATMEQFGNGATGTSGEHLYKEIVFEMRRNGSKTPEADASKWLNQQGISGIRYLDEGSRSKPYAVAISTKKGPYAESEFSTKEQAEQYIKEKQAEGFKTELKEIGTSNFVVFDPSTVKILEKNDKKVEGLLD